ncbi:MAG: 4Fe-4S binding protein [Oscillospiraceae bacterium]|nr:4Fe-4S binding protein [Oscillospiraceae bacterium]
MSEVNFKQQIKEFAEKAGIDLIGFAAKERFDGLDKRYNPFSIFPEAETVILLGRRITRGTLRGIEEGSNFTDYPMWGYSWLEDIFISQVCYDLTCFIENAGYEAVPIFPNPKESYGMGVPVAPDRPAPNVAPDFDYAAVACGLGEISLNDVFLSYRFGPRQRFQMIITDAPLESDPLSDRKICDKCGRCAKICPLNAIDPNTTKEITICGKTMETAQIDYSMCRRCRNGAGGNRLIGSAKPDRHAALCNRTCIINLEEKNLIDNTFENPFRTSPPWGKDVLERIVTVNEEE